MKQPVIIYLAVIIILTCCSKEAENFKTEEQNGVKIFSNTETPSDPDCKLDLKKLFTISSEAQTDTNAYFKMPISMTADSNNNIYILDNSLMNVKKFDSSGNFVKSIGRMGQGPGEFLYPWIIFIEKDTLKIISYELSKISKFDLEGNFFSDKVFTDMPLLQNMKISKDGKKSVSYIPKRTYKEGQEYPIIDYALSIVEMSDMKEKLVITSKRTSFQDILDGKIDFNDLRNPFSPGNDFVYLSDNSDRQYRIFGYDYEGKKKIEIRKDFKLIRYDNKEKEEYLASIKKRLPNSKELKKSNFKKAIAAIYKDKYDRLLVYPNVDRNVDKDGVYIDIFKDGKFLNRVNYNQIQNKENVGWIGEMNSEEFYIGDRLYVLKEKDQSVDVYDY